jgi:hypothetical protein
MVFVRGLANASRLLSTTPVPVMAVKVKKFLLDNIVGLGIK